MSDGTGPIGEVPADADAGQAIVPAGGTAIVPAGGTAIVQACPPGITTEDIDHKDYLRWMCMDGYDSRVLPLIADDPEKQAEYMARLDEELDVIDEMGFIDYFLIVQDYVNYARAHGMPTGPGRGCLLPGVLVPTANRGPVPIECVRRGDTVYDEAGEEVAVEQTHRYDLDERVVLLIVDSHDRGTVRLGLTGDHRVLCEAAGGGTGWVRAEDIREGAVIAADRDASRPGHRVEIAVTERRTGFVYDLTVDTANEPSYLTECGVVHNSAAGSLVSYLVGITRVDPIPFKLFFERFLNKGRSGMPDIDVDFPQGKRQEIMEYVRQRYGTERAAQVMTFSYEKAKSSIKDVARVLGYPPNVADRITKMISGDPKATIAKELAAEGDFYRSYHGDPETRRIVDEARKIEGFIRGDSIHASAVVIAPHSLAGHMPMQTPKGQHGKLSADDTASFLVQLDGKTVEKMGYLKMDFLGLGNLDAIANTQRLIEQVHGTKIELEDIPFDDARTFALLRRAETFGLFQVESGGMQKTLLEVQPTRFGELSDIIALYRPGPMEYIPIYCENKADPSKIAYLDERLRPILEETYGIAVYQESLMEIAKSIAGFDLVRADDLRKAIGKKDLDLMASMKAEFAEGCRGTGTDETTIEALWALMEAAGNYSFNKCLTFDCLITRGAAGRYDPSPDITIGKLYENWHSKTAVGSKYRDPKRGVKILGMDTDGRIRPRRLTGVFEQGVQPVWRIRTEDSHELKCTANHRSLTDRGWIQTSEMVVGDSLMTSRGYEYVQYDYRTSKVDPSNPASLIKGRHNWATGAGIPPSERGYIDGSYRKLQEWRASAPDTCNADPSHTGRIETHHKDRDRTNNEPENLEKLCVSCHKKADYALGRRKQWQKGHAADWSPIVSIEYVGEEMTYDLEVEDDPNGHEGNAFGHNFVANGIVTHNSHSVAYAFVSYYTAYFKANYPAEFICSMMSYHKNHQKSVEKLGNYMKDCRRYGVEVTPPHVNHSDVDFDVPEPMTISFGLMALKKVGEGEAAAIVAERRRGGPFTDLNDFLDRTSVNGGVLEKLARSGALDGLGWTRKALVDGIDRIKDFRKMVKKGSKYGDQPDLFDLLGGAEAIPTARIEPEHDDEYGPDMLLEQERDELGFYLSGHPLEYYELSRRVKARSMGRITHLSEIASTPDKMEVNVFGSVAAVRRWESKKGTMGFVQLTDFGLEDEGVHGYAPQMYEFDMVIFSDEFRDWGSRLKEGDFLAVRGKVDTRRDNGQKGFTANSATVMPRDTTLDGPDSPIAGTIAAVRAEMEADHDRWSRPAPEEVPPLEIHAGPDAIQGILDAAARLPGGTRAILVVDGHRKDLGGIAYGGKMKLILDYLGAEVKDG